MVAIDAWQEHGFGAVAKDYLARLSPEKKCSAPSMVSREISWSRQAGDARSRPRRAAGNDCQLARPSWLDPSDRRAALGWLLRTIRLDPSDTFVFEKAAEPGEWAVPGSFVFWNQDPSALEGKARSAFRAGILGIGSLGWSTLAQIVEADDTQHAAAIDMLAHRLVENFGAPDLTLARLAASEEIAYASSLCDSPAGHCPGRGASRLRG